MNKNFKYTTLTVLPLGRPRHRYKDNTEMDLQDTGLGSRGTCWIDRNQTSDKQHSCEHDYEPPHSIKYGEFLD